MYFPNNNRVITKTELDRIKHTIESLERSTSLLDEKLLCLSQSSETTKECHNHALEIVWGWEQLLKEIRELPETCIDKSFFEQSALKNLKWAIKLLERTQNQYLGREDVYPRDNILLCGSEKFE